MNGTLTGFLIWWGFISAMIFWPLWESWRERRNAVPRDAEDLPLKD